MTKQFLSESINYLDYIIFAVAPIGIITALVSTIRLCGSTALRAFVGRSQEGQGTVEAELCTSTSRDVCELFTRGGIQRVLGRPSILELVYLPSHEDSVRSPEEKAKAYPELFLSKEYFTENARMADSPWKELGWLPTRGRKAPMVAPNPNLSLNIGIRRPPNWILVTIAIVGLVLQIGVLALAGVGVWNLGWNLSEGGGSAARDYAPIMFIVGTTLLCTGMWGCAFLIGQTTQEVRFERKSDTTQGGKPRLVWVQPGPQVIGDQSFDSFAYVEDKNTINIWYSSRKALDKSFELYTYAAVLSTLIGYIVQFIGIRGMKAWVSLAQLGVTIIMSLLRGGLRTQRLGQDDNELDRMPDLVTGHELDWLAYRIAFEGKDSLRHTTWHVTAQHGKGVEGQHLPQRELEKSFVTIDKEMSNSPATAAGDQQNSVDSGSHGVGMEGLTLHVRSRLAHLTGLSDSAEGDHRYHQVWKDEHVNVRARARQLSSVFRTALSSKRSGGSAKNIDLRIFATTMDGSKSMTEPIILTLKAPPEFSQVGWRLDAAQLEAVLGLWLWTILLDRLGHETSDSREGGHTVSINTRSRGMQVGRIVSLGRDAPEWHNENDIQEEMDLWLGRSSVEFQQGVLTIYPSDAHGLATTFTGDEKEKKAFRVVAKEEGILISTSRGYLKGQQRFCGWTLAHQAIKADTRESFSANANSTKPDDNEATLSKYRFQYTQLPRNVPLLDLCSQELFVAMMMSLIDFEAEQLEPATFLESGDTLRLEHAIVSEFADAFVTAGLGTYSDALMCIVPALRKKISPLKPDTILSALMSAAQTYRRDSQWKRAETLLRFGYKRSNKQGVSPSHSAQALTALCELYRWALSMFTDTERNLGLDGIDWVVKTSVDLQKSDQQSKSIVDCYAEIARRFKSGQADEGRQPADARIKKTPLRLRFIRRPHETGTQFRLEENQEQLLDAIQKRNQTEALYQLCLLTPDCGDAASVPSSALSLAASNDWPNIVSILLELGASPNDADQSGRRAIYHCAELGHEACAKILLEYNASLEMTMSKRGESLMLLHAAAHNGHSGMVRLIMNTGSVEKNQIDDMKNTPLMVASSMGRSEVVQLLLNTPDVTIERADIPGSPLTCAAESGNVDVIRILLDTHSMDLERTGRYGRTPLLSAISNGHQEAAMLLIDRGANIEATDKKTGQRALARAVELQNVPLIRRLLEKGAKTDMKDNRQKTPLMDATSLICDTSRIKGGSQEARDRRIKEVHVCKEVADLLLEQHGDTEIQGEKGMTALAQAARTNNTESLQILLSRGADKESRDDKGRTPLMHAAKKEARDTLTRLLDAGCDVEAKDAKGKTALFHAMRSRDMIEKLVDRGADLEARDNQNETLLLKVQQERNATMAKFLIDKGADGEILGLSGNSVRYWVKDCGYL